MCANFASGFELSCSQKHTPKQSMSTDTGLSTIVNCSTSKLSCRKPSTTAVVPVEGLHFHESNADDVMSLMPMYGLLAQALKQSQLQQSAVWSAAEISIATFRQYSNVDVHSAGSPSALDLFRSNRVLQQGRLHWSSPGKSTPHSPRRVFSETPLSVQMVRTLE